MLCFLEAPEMYNPYNFFGRITGAKTTTLKKQLTESPHNRLHPFPEMAPEGSAKYLNPDNTAAAETPDRAVKGLNAEAQ